VNSMSKDQRVLEAVQHAVNEVNQQRPEGERIGLSVETPLVGESGTLDSLGLISLLVAVEQEIEKEFHVEITLTEDERVLSDHQSPVRNVGALVDYLKGVLEE
jgi:D-alanine--poly(phosphoribitol) ligase subunit 2